MSEELKKIIAANILYYLENTGYTQNDLAEYLGVTAAAVSNWCNGTKMPRPQFIDKIADFFGINRNQLLIEQELFSYITNCGRYYSCACNERPELETLFLLGDVASDEELHKIVEIAKTILGNKAEQIKRI